MDPATMERCEKAIQIGKKNIKKVIKIQAFLRGAMVRSLVSRKKSDLSKKLSSSRSS
jgi:hypothetical protein